MVAKSQTLTKAVAGLFFAVLALTCLTFRAESAPQNHWSLWRVRDPYTVKFAKEAGKESVQLSCPAGEDDIFGIYQQFKAQKYLGTHLKLDFTARLNGVKDNANCWIVVSDADRTPLTFADLEGKKMHGDMSGKKYSIVVDVPKTAHSIMIGYSQTGAGSSTFGLPKLSVTSEHVTSVKKKIDDSKFPVIGRLGEKLDLKFRKAEKSTPPETELSNFGASINENYATTVENDSSQADTVAHISGNENAKGFTTFYQQVRADEYRGQKLRFHALIKAKDVKDWSGIWMRFDGDGKVLAFDNMEPRPVKGTSNWQDYSVVLSVPLNARFLRVGFMLAGPGDVWFAAPALEKASDSEKETVTGFKPIPIPRPELLEAPSLSFEHE